MIVECVSAGKNNELADVRNLKDEKLLEIPK
jgi:hypothetical protein